jgi:hypothetical protein
MTELDELLSDYGLIRENAVEYIDAVIRMNMSQAADEMGVSTDTVHRYKRAFADMTEEERAFILVSLFGERHRELTR